MPSINFLAVIVMAVISMVLGSIWYSPIGFGKLWEKLSGVKVGEGAEVNANVMYFLTAVASLVRAFGVALFVGWLSVTGLTNGLFLGLVIWVVFVFPPFVATYLFGGRGFKLLLLDSSYYLVDLLVAGALITAWR